MDCIARQTLSLGSYRQILYHLNHQGSAKVLIAESCPTLCNPLNCSPPGSSVHGILQAGECWSGEQMPFPSPGDLPDPDLTWVSCIVGRFFTIWATREAPARQLGWRSNVLPESLGLDCFSWKQFACQRGTYWGGKFCLARLVNTCISMADSCQCMTKTTTML